MSSSSNVVWHRLCSLGNDLGVGNGGIPEVVVVGSWGSSIVVSSNWSSGIVVGSNGGSNVSQSRGSNRGSHGSVVVSHGGSNHGGGNSDGLLVDVGLGSNLDINVRLGSDVSPM